MRNWTAPRRLSNTDDEHRIEWLKHQWAIAEPQLSQWIDASAHAPCVALVVPHASVLVAQDTCLTLAPGAMQIEVASPWRKEAAQRYQSRTAFQPVPPTGA